MSDWYDRLVSRHGDAIPAAEDLQIRPNLQPIVDELFAALSGYRVRVYGITERDEGLVVIDARVSDDITAADKTAVYAILEEYQERLND
ncbi:hypothetical protein ACQKKX_04435 [Neorhizobium sp. NPDC001467]|uniref:hypothetical protein n=1 Tax=Neorhizobium sp. NPDC001467 TaxID=3390595 RepID=UPI003D0674BE